MRNVLYHGLSSVNSHNPFDARWGVINEKHRKPLGITEQLTAIIRRGIFEVHACSLEWLMNSLPLAWTRWPKFCHSIIITRVALRTTFIEKKKNQHTFTYLNSIFTSPFPAHVGTADGLFAGRLFVLWLHFLQEWRRVLLVWTPVGFIQCHGGGSPDDACPPCVI